MEFISNTIIVVGTAAVLAMVTFFLLGTDLFKLARCCKGNDQVEHGNIIDCVHKSNDWQIFYSGQTCGNAS